MTKNILEKLQDTNPECEIWWDSSPLVYENWAKGMVAKAPAQKKAAWEEQLKRLFDPEDASGMFFRSSTTNPPLSLNAIHDNPTAWAEYVKGLIEENPDDSVEDIYWKVYKEVVRRGAALIRPKWDATKGKYGYISGQVDPRFVYDYDAMHKQAMEIAALAPNIVVKCPGSKEGYRLLEELTALGIGTNNTTSFVVPQYIACMNAVTRGLERAAKNGVDMFRWRSVITHMSARYGSLGDLKKQADARGIQLTPSDIRWAELAIYKRAYFWGLERKHPSKMLMCSMRVDKDVEPGTVSSWHVEKIAGSNSVYTCPPKYIGAMMEVEDSLKPFDAEAINEEAPKDVIDKLMRLPYFEQGYEYDGMAEEEFGRYGCFVATAAEFSAATRATVDFVAQQFAEMGKVVLKKEKVEAAA
jgi:transaldolase